LRVSLLVILLFCFSPLLYNQQLVWQKEIIADKLYVDPLEKVYTVKGSVVDKYSAKGAFIQTYNNLAYGDIHSLDTRNALQTMVFYKDQQQIVMLDNMLGETNQIDLSESFEWIDLACLSNRDDSFWFYSSIDQSIIKVNDQLNTQLKTKNIAQLLSVDLSPTQLIEYNETLYLWDEENGLFLFDLFGNFKKKIPLKDKKKVQITEKGVVFNTETNIDLFNTQTFDYSNLFKESVLLIDFWVSKGSIYLLNKEKLIKYER